jgi:hypothetical protein
MSIDRDIDDMFGDTVKAAADTSIQPMIVSASTATIVKSDSAGKIAPINFNPSEDSKNEK